MIPILFNTYSHILSIFLFTIIAFFTSCGNNFKHNEIKTEFDQTSNFGRFLSTKYFLKKGDSDVALNIISKSKNLQSDLTLAELNFNSHLINGNFDKWNKVFNKCFLSKN